MITEVKYKGITTSPSDYESPDGDLAIGSNIISDNGALVVPDPSPTPKIEFGSNKPIFIHTPLGGTMANYIVQNGQKIRYWTYKEGDTPSLTDSDNIYTMAEGEGLYQCTAVGNTLVVLTSAGINYFLFKDGAYKNLGKELPETLLEFHVRSDVRTGNTTYLSDLYEWKNIVKSSKTAIYTTPFYKYTGYRADGIIPLKETFYAWQDVESASTYYYTKEEDFYENQVILSSSGEEIGHVDGERLTFKYSSIGNITKDGTTPLGFADGFAVEYRGHTGDIALSDFVPSGGWNASTDSITLRLDTNSILIKLGSTAVARNITITFNNNGQTATIMLYQLASVVQRPTWLSRDREVVVILNSDNTKHYIKRYASGDIIHEYEEGLKYNRIQHSGSGGAGFSVDVYLKFLISDYDSLSPQHVLRSDYSYKIALSSNRNNAQFMEVYLSINDTLAASSSDYTNSSVWERQHPTIDNNSDALPNCSLVVKSGSTQGATISGKYKYIIIVIRDYAQWTSNRGADIGFDEVIASIDESSTVTTSSMDFALTEDNKADESLYKRTMGAVNDFLKDECFDNEKFVYPFFVRYAYRLFDGSISNPSAPILMIPCSGPTPFVSINLAYTDRIEHQITAYCADLYFTNKTANNGLSNYSDIITGIVIGVSSQIYTINQGHKFDEDKKNIELVPFGADGSDADKMFGFHYLRRVNSYAKVSQMSTMRPQQFSNYYAVKLPSFTPKELCDKTVQNGTFYVVKEYSLSEFVGYTTATKVELDNGTLLDNALETREVMSDNAMSLTRLIPQNAFMYNNRLNVANYDQIIYNGFPASLMCGHYTKASTTVAMGSSVKGTADMQTFIVNRKYDNNIKNGGLHWFFYPNNNATLAVINGKEITLKQHPILNGSYWIDAFDELDGITTASNPEGSSQAVVNILAEHRNKIMKATGVVTGTRIVFTYKKIAKLDPTTDVNSINAPMESFVHTITASEVTNGFYINESGSAEAVAGEITNRIVKVTIYASVTAVQVGSDGTFSNVAFNTGAILSYPNKIASSIINNPFTFEASGVSQIQSERIVALSSATKALGQEQHGTHPLYVFTNDGVFGMQVDSEGKYTTKNPVCRDVVLGGGESITQIDDAVVFASARGIMSLAGEQAVCISEKLNELLIPPVAISIPPIITEGRIRSGSGQPLEPMIGCKKEPFKEYVNGAIIIFDYLNQRLIVSNKDYDYSYVYSIRTKQWSYYDAIYVSSLNSYPDGLAVDGANNVVDVADSTVNQYVAGTDKYSGWFLTRPISLGDSESYKIIDFVRQNGIYRQFSLYAWSNGSTTYYTPSETPNVGDFIYDSNGNRIWSGLIPNIHITEVGTTGSPAVPYIKVNIPRSSAFNRSASDIVANNTMSRITSVDAPSGGDDGSGKYSVQEYANAVGEGYISNAIQQVLYGSNDLINWHIISSSRSPRISDYSGSPYKWFRLAVRCTFLAGGSLSSVTFSWRKKFDNTKLL